MKTTATSTTSTTSSTKAGQLAGDKAHSINELHKIGVVGIGATSLFFGVWAAACMTAGVVTSGGPAGLAMEYIRALI
jgi:hypothetical protein